jgi:hypothetical protein
MEGKVLSGREFNSIFKGRMFVKLTNDKEVHNGFKYETGLNVDNVPFNPTGECKAGGIYFCELEMVGVWLKYRGMQMVYLRNVDVPNEANVYVENYKYKADRLILGQRELICDVIGQQKCMIAIEKGSLSLQHVDKQMQTEIICLLAVKRDGMSLKYVQEQTESICLAAVRKNGQALRYVEEQTKEICKEAVREDGWALKYVGNQTLDICLAAIYQEATALKFVRDQTEEICLAAVTVNPWTLEFVKEQTETISLAAVKQYGMALKCVREQTEEICIAAVQQYGGALRFVRKKTADIVRAAE